MDYTQATFDEALRQNRLSYPQRYFHNSDGFINPNCIAAMDAEERKLFRQIIVLEYKLGFRNQKLKARIDELKAMLPEKTSSFNPYMFITINPKPDIKLKTFQIICERYANRKMFENYLYVLEQRGTENAHDLGSGFHCHFLIERKKAYKPSQVKKNTKSTFKNLVGNNKHIDFGPVSGKSGLQNRQSYMLDKKKNPLKQLKQAGDVIWRNTNDLEPFYGNKYILDIDTTTNNAV